MKITQVEPQKKNPRRFNIYLDGTFAFGADEDLVVDQRLVVGKVLETPDVESILFEAEVGKLMERMYKLLNIRQRSEREIRDYLRNLSFKRKVKGDEQLSDLVIERLVEKLKQKELVNDWEFAKAWVEARRSFKKKGRNALKQELFQKGINREIIEEIISGQITVDSEQEIAQQALGKKLKAWQDLEPMEFKKKAYQFLVRRGFEYQVVQEVVAKELVFFSRKR